MLEQLVAFSVARRGVVVTLWSIVLLIALFSIKQLSIDAVPDVTNIQVSIITTAPGLSPVEVEKYLTYPVEMAMNGLPGVVQIRSISRTAVSAVNVVFTDETNLWFARQLVGERLKLAEADIPPGYGRPELAPATTALGEIYSFYLASKQHSPMELRTLLDWVVAYKLRSVPGVIEVNAMGGESKQYQVILDARKLGSYKISLQQVYEALANNNGSIGGGYIEKNSESYVIRGDALIKDLSDIENTMVTVDQDGTPILIKQLAKVALGPALRFGVVTKHNIGEIAAGTVMMLVGGNSRQVVDKVKSKLLDIQKDLPEGVEIHPYYDRAEFIGRMLHTVAFNLTEGAALVVVVLFLTLGSFAGSLLAALAIPLAMSTAVLGMIQLHVTGNLMSLGAIDFGLLVDGAIVMLEATLAQLTSQSIRTRQDVAAVVTTAMQGAARPVTFSLGIILLVYLPLMALEGMEGRMFRPMAITVALAIAGALLFTLTCFPALSAFFLPIPKQHAHGHHGGMFTKLVPLYDKVLHYGFHHSQHVLALALMVLVITGVLGSRLGAEFVPRLDEGEISLDVRRLPSISISEAQRLGYQVEQVLAQFPEVISVVTRTGRAEVATDPVGPDECDTLVKLRPKEEWQSAPDLDSLGTLIKQAIETRVPATFVAVSQPIEDRVNQLLAGSKADVAIKLFGNDLDILKQTADQFAKAIRDVPGVGDLRVQRILGLPLLEIRPQRDKLARYGIPAREVLSVVEASRVGLVAGRIFEGERRFDMALFLPPNTLTPEAFGELLVSSPSGQILPLASVAEIQEREGPAVINREDLQRRIMVEANVRGRDLVSFVSDAQQRVAAIPLPQGVRVKWGGQFENFQRASARLALVVPMALAAILAMLFFMFGEMRYVLIVFSGVPLSLIGGISSLLIRDLPFSIPAAVGFIAVAGVAVLNGVVMGSDIQRRLSQHQTVIGYELFRQGAQHVLRPILTTALVAAIGFLPMAISTRAGAEVQRPLATVVIGGIISSTLLSLLILPVLLSLFAPRPHQAKQG